MATADKALAMLHLFTMEEPDWTVEQAAERLKLSISTAYEYASNLANAGLIVGVGRGHYALGPAILIMDRVMRRHDPLITAAAPFMDELAAEGTMPPAVALLCRLFRFQVMCVDQRSSGGPKFGIGYERGRPMPLLRGAASKAILAHMPSRTTRRLWADDDAAVAAAGLGTDWTSFKRTLRMLRGEPVLVSRGEIDPGMVGLSAAVFNGDGVIGSIGIVIAERDATRDLTELSALISTAASGLSGRLAGT